MRRAASRTGSRARIRPSEVFDRVTSPITEYYRRRNLVIEISALGSVAEVTERSMVALRDRGLRADREDPRDCDP
jgi:adenylate kinase family enzyme